RDEGVGGTALARARMKLLGERGQLGRDAVAAIDSGPGRRGMAAAQILLVLVLVAGAAVGSRQRLAGDEARGVVLALFLGRLMALETGDALLGVGAHLVFVHDRVLLLGVTFGTLARRLDETRAGLPRLDGRPPRIDEEAAEHETEADNDGDEDGA